MKIHILSFIIMAVSVTVYGETVFHFDARFIPTYPQAKIVWRDSCQQEPCKFAISKTQTHIQFYPLGLQYLALPKFSVIEIVETSEHTSLPVREYVEYVPEMHLCLSDRRAWQDRDTARLAAPVSDLGEISNIVAELSKRACPE